jgi:hypothetical protein
VLLGPPLEVRMASAPPAAPGAAAAPSYSAVAGAGVGAAGGLAGSGGPGVSVVAFSVAHEQHALLLFIEVLPRFPEEQPVITLQSVRWVGGDWLSRLWRRTAGAVPSSPRAITLQRA